MTQQYGDGPKGWQDMQDDPLRILAGCLQAFDYVKARTEKLAADNGLVLPPVAMADIMHKKVGDFNFYKPVSDKAKEFFANQHYVITDRADPGPEWYNFGEWQPDKASQEFAGMNVSGEEESAPSSRKIMAADDFEFIQKRMKELQRFKPIADADFKHLLHNGRNLNPTEALEVAAAYNCRKGEKQTCYWSSSKFCITNGRCCCQEDPTTLGEAAR